MNNFSNRIAAMPSSPMRKLAPFAEKAKMEGKTIYHLNIGQPDILTPENFMNAVKNFDEKVLAYSSSQGMPVLIDAIIKYYTKYDMHFENDEVLITNGGSEALIFALLSIGDTGDEIIVPEPFYPNYNGFANTAGVKVVPITTHASNGFHLPDKNEIEKVITDKSKAILLSNPGNPTGVVYTKEEIHMLSNLAKKHDLFIIADEVYREFVYGDSEYTSFGNIKEIEDRVIIIDSVSKRFSACGARIGAVLSKNKELMAQMLKLCQSRLCCPTLDQIGSAELFNVSNDYFKDINVEYKKRRDIAYAGLKEIPGVICEEPKGAFYLIAKLPVDNAETFVKWLLTDFNLDNETVMLTPAKGFYATPNSGLDEVRIAYILNENRLKRAMHILKVALEKYNNK